MTNQIKVLSAHIVELVWEKKGTSKAGKPYTAYSMLLVPFRGEGVFVDNEDKIWVSCGFNKPVVNKGDMVNVSYEAAGPQGQWKNVVNVEYSRDEDKRDAVMHDPENFLEEGQQ